MTDTVFAFSGRRGVGKDTLKKYMLDAYPQVRRLVAHTTRPPRNGEIEGIHYHFVSHTEFERMIAAGELAGFDMVSCNYYGPSVRELMLPSNTLADFTPKINWVVRDFLRTTHRRHFSIGVTVQSACILRNRLLKRGHNAAEADVIMNTDPNTEQMCDLASFDLLVDNSNDDEGASAAARIINDYRVKRILGGS